MTRSPLDTLAVAIRDRRAALGLAQGDLASRGGPSLVTVGQLERAQIARPQPATLARIDTALGWPSGTCAAILRGEPAPTLVTPPSDTATPHVKDKGPDDGPPLSALDESALEDTIRRGLDQMEEDFRRTSAAMEELRRRRDG